VPPRIAAQLAADIRKVVVQPRIREAFERQGAEAAAESGPEAYSKLMTREYERYVKLVREVGLTPQ